MLSQTGLLLLLLLVNVVVVDVDLVDNGLQMPLLLSRSHCLGHVSRGGGGGLNKRSVILDNALLST